MKEIDISLRPQVTNYDGYLLLKFTSSFEYQQNFLEGKLFFNTADFFARCDEKGRGDRAEGSTFVVNENDQGFVSVNFEMVNNIPMIVERDYSKNPEAYKPSTVLSYSHASNRFRKMICFYTAYVNTQKNEISNFDKNMEHEFGKYGVLILDRVKFYDRIVTTLKNKNYREAKMGFVEYRNRTPGINEWNPFRKDNIYSYQNEFRITFVNDTCKPVLLDLGTSLRDIAVPISASDLDQISIVNGSGIRYPIYKMEKD